MPLSFAGPALIAVRPAGTALRAGVLETVWSAPLVKLGASFTAVTVIVNVCGALVSTPPFAVPPLSCSVTVIVAVPIAFGRRRVGQRAIRGASRGCAENSAVVVVRRR